jgi:hypothetical protein
MNEHLEQEALRARARERQRRYRAGRPRIDYFPDRSAVATIDSLRTRYAGGDASSIINRIVLEWSSSRGRDSPPSVMSAKRALDGLIDGCRSAAAF